MHLDEHSVMHLDEEAHDGMRTRLPTHRAAGHLARRQGAHAMHAQGDTGCARYVLCACVAAGGPHHSTAQALSAGVEGQPCLSAAARWGGLRHAAKACLPVNLSVAQ